LRPLAFLVLLAPAIAHAEDDPSATSDDPPATAPVVTVAAPTGERVTMPAKRGMVRALLGINLSSESSGDPVSLSPDVWYGVNDKLTVGLVHTLVGATGIYGIPGTSLCLTGDACGDVYNFVGLDARYTLKSDAKMAIAFDGGLFMTALDPFQLALKLGASGRYRATKKLALDFSPNVFVGITEREGAVMTQGNKEVLTLPMSAVYEVNDKIGLMAQVALSLPFAEAGDFYFISYSIGGSYAVNKQLAIELAFSLPLAVSGSDAGGFDARTMTIGGAYAF
jgi:hypothetical protein